MSSPSGPPSAEPARRTNPALVMTAAIVGSSMAMIDGTAVNVALPVMGRELHATVARTQWVVEGYALFLSALILIGGALGDAYGRRRVFAIGIALFALASVACALAPTDAALVAARCVQGAGAALAVPGSLALLGTAFEGEARGRAIGTWSGASAITSAIGPLLGGWLVQHASWRWVFAINVPLAAVALAALAGVAESRKPGAARLDVAGAALATAGLGALVYGLVALQTPPGAARAGGSLALGAGWCAAGLATLALFVRHEARTRAPMMPLAVFRSRAFSVANAYSLLLYFAIGGSLFFIPFDLLDVQRWTPVAAGASLLPTIGMIAIGSRFTGALVPRLGARLLLALGAVVAGAAFVLFSALGVGAGYWANVFPAALTLGAGAALFVAPLSTAIMDAVDVADSGLASGINNAVARTAGLLAVAVLGIVLAATLDGSVRARVAASTLAPPVRATALRTYALVAAGAPVPELTPAARASVEPIVDAAYADAFRAVMLTSAGAAFVAAALAWTLLAPRRAKLIEGSRAA